MDRFTLLSSRVNRLMIDAENGLYVLGKHKEARAKLERLEPLSLELWKLNRIGRQTAFRTDGGIATCSVRKFANFGTWSERHVKRGNN